MRTECKQKNISDDSRVGKKKHNVVPIAHAYILGGKLPFENVDNSVLILDRFDRVGDKYKQRSQREACTKHDQISKISDNLKIVVERFELIFANLK